MTDELARCPFCNGDGLVVVKSGTEDAFLVQCVGCLARGPLVFVRPTMEQAAARAWNRGAKRKAAKQ
jgi:hypothetical protein